MIINENLLVNFLKFNDLIILIYNGVKKASPMPMLKIRGILKIFLYFDSNKSNLLKSIKSTIYKKRTIKVIKQEIGIVNFLIIKQ